MQQVIKNLSAQPLLCVTFSVLVFLFSSLTNYLLLDSLLKMHRSKTAVRKLRKGYTFLQRMRLLHFKENCRHAIKFCNGMIIYQKIGWLCRAIYLLIALLFAFGVYSAVFVARLTVGIFLLFDVPVFAIDLLLARPVMFRRFREFSFEKYHNTDNHDSLF